MHRSFLALPIFCLVAGCAHEADLPEVSSAPPAFTSAVAADREVIAVDAMPVEPAAPAPRPRLDHVVTLGEKTYEPSTPVPPDSAGNGGVVNNNITVNGGTPYYGGYGGYGYYGSSYGAGARSTGRSRGTTTRSTGTVSPELGAAAQAPAVRPGQTPGVGGNWPTIPSSGPRQMR